MDDPHPTEPAIQAEQRAEIERRLFSAVWRAWESLWLVYAFTPPGVGLLDPLPPPPAREANAYSAAAFGGIRQADGSVLWARFEDVHQGFRKGLDHPLLATIWSRAIPLGLWGGDFSAIGLPRKSFTSFEMLRLVHKACLGPRPMPLIETEELPLMPRKLRDWRGPLNPTGLPLPVSLPMLIWRIQEVEPGDSQVRAAREAIRYVQLRETHALRRGPWRCGTVPAHWRAWAVEMETGYSPYPGDPRFWVTKAEGFTGRNPKLGLYGFDTWLHRTTLSLAWLPFEPGPVFLLRDPGSDQCVLQPAKDGIRQRWGVGHRHDLRLLTEKGWCFDPDLANAWHRWFRNRSFFDNRREFERRHRMLPPQLRGWRERGPCKGLYGAFDAGGPLVGMTIPQQRASSWFLFTGTALVHKPVAEWITEYEDDARGLALAEAGLMPGRYWSMLEPEDPADGWSGHAFATGFRDPKAPGRLLPG